MNAPDFSDCELLPGDVQLREAAAIRREELREALTREAIVGRGDFWPTGPWPHGRPKYDNEQELRVFEGVRAAVAAIGLTDAERWKVLWRVIANEIDAYAAMKAEE